MHQQAIVIHERLSTWARQLRPRLGSGSIAWAESRSSEDLARALAGQVAPLVVIDLGDASTRRLADLALARQAAPDGLILVLHASGRPGIAELARELGATQVVLGPATPLEVVRILSRWIPLARRRAQGSGWPMREESSDPWETDASFKADPSAILGHPAH